jgi:hypothetical protein
MRLPTALVIAVLALAAPACGGTDDTERARDLYRAYRAAEDDRTGAEDRLRQAFVDIAAAAETRDRASSRAAVGRGQQAVTDIEELLRRELEAAERLDAFADVSSHAAKLRDGIEATNASLGLFSKELDIAALDPFLVDKANADEIRRLARRAAKLAVEGELDIRRADRALAVALGLEPRLDPGVDAETGTVP